MIRLVSVGASSEQHRRALDILGAPHLAFLPQNHVVPVLNRIVYDNKYHFAVLPMMQDVLLLPNFHDYLEAADYVEQLVEVSHVHALFCLFLCDQLKSAQGLDFFHGRLVSHGVHLLFLRRSYMNIDRSTVSRIFPKQIFSSTSSDDL